MATDIPNAVILKNRGFPIDVHKVEADEQGRLSRVYNSADEPVLEKTWFQLTNADLAAIEEPEPSGWGSLEKWQEALEERPFNTIAKTLAICHGLMNSMPDGRIVPDTRQAGLLMKDGEFMTYMAVMSGALMIAQGVDPELAGETVRKGIKEAREAVERESATLTSQTEAVSPGHDGLQGGQPSDVTMTSSGG